QAVVGPVEGEIADPRVGKEPPLLARVDIDRVEVAVRVILIDVESGAVRGIEGDAGDLVEHHSIEVGEVRHLAGREVHLAEEANAARIADSSDEAGGLLVADPARHRAESGRAEMVYVSQRIFPERGEIFALE